MTYILKNSNVYHIFIILNKISLHLIILHFLCIFVVIWGYYNLSAQNSGK